MSREFPRPLTGTGESRRFPASTKQRSEKAAPGVAPLVRHADRAMPVRLGNADRFAVGCVAAQELVAGLYDNLLAVGDALDASDVGSSGSERLEAACAAAEALCDLAGRLAEAAHEFDGEALDGGWWLGAA